MSTLIQELEEAESEANRAAAALASFAGANFAADMERHRDLAARLHKRIEHVKRLKEVRMLDTVGCCDNAAGEAIHSLIGDLP